MPNRLPAPSDGCVLKRLKVLLDAMYPPALAEALRAHGIEVSMVAERGWPDGLTLTSWPRLRQMGPFCSPRTSPTLLRSPQSTSRRVDITLAF
jgi:hypothetical protein